MAKLVGVNSAIHDCWFRVSEVVHDPEAGVVSVPFLKRAPERRRALTRWGPIARFAIPVYRWTLLIENVEKLDLNETQNVDRYDFNVLTWLPGEETIEVTTGIPLVFKVQVSSFEVKIRKSDREVEQIHRIGLAFL